MRRVAVVEGDASFSTGRSHPPASVIALTTAARTRIAPTIRATPVPTIPPPGGELGSIDYPPRVRRSSGLLTFDGSGPQAGCLPREARRRRAPAARNSSEGVDHAAVRREASVSATPKASARAAAGVPYRRRITLADGQRADW